MLLDSDTGQVLAERNAQRKVESPLLLSQAHPMCGTTRSLDAQTLAESLKQHLPMTPPPEHKKYTDPRIITQCNCRHASGLDSLMYVRAGAHHWALIVLNAKNESTLHASTSVLLDYAEHFYKKADINEELSWPKMIKVYLGQNLTYEAHRLPFITLPAHIHSWTSQVVWHEPVIAPIAQHQTIGAIEVRDAHNALLYTQEIRARQNIPIQPGLRYYIDLIYLYFMNREGQKP